MHHVVVHAHCYQPPREDPWLESVPTEPSAAPDHDWNARINHECYARLADAEVRQPHAGALANDPDAPSGVARLINLYGWCTFDVGATLCEWMDTEAPDTLRAMVAGDAASVRRLGHGNALAAPYHHVILPLASPRDRRTEVRWGIADFQRRFGRSPVGMWLPECAVDDDTLDLLAAEGIAFTILAPYQVETAGETHGLPVRWRGAAGRTLTILPYDGSLAGEVAFGGLLRDPAALARRLAPTLHDGQSRCTTLATDGETFGHHHRHGARALASAMAMIGQRPDARLTNAATMVATMPATLTARLVSPSSWSCAHGVERWRSNCGCRIDHDRPAAQQWRGPLRVALAALAHDSDAVFEREGAALFSDNPWSVRDAYGAVVAADGEALQQFVQRMTRTDLDDAGVQRARELLELQRATLRLFTSCAWFFDDVDRLEARQVLRYAARVLELSGLSGRLEPTLVRALSAARATTAGSPSASELFTSAARPHHHAAIDVAAGAMAMVDAGHPCTRVDVYDVHVAHVATSGASYVVTLRHRRTGRVLTVIGTVTGVGPTLRVTVTETGADGGTARDVAVHEMPESLSLTLLRPYAMDETLTG